MSGRTFFATAVMGMATQKGREEVAAGSCCQNRTSLPSQGDKMPGAASAFLQKFFSGADPGHGSPCLKQDYPNASGSTWCSRAALYCGRRL